MARGSPDRTSMDDRRTPADALPPIDPPSDDARVALALHALADLRVQLQGAQRGVAGSVAALSGVSGPDDAVPPVGRT